MKERDRRTPFNDRTVTKFWNQGIKILRRDEQYHDEGFGEVLENGKTKKIENIGTLETYNWTVVWDRGVAVS